VLSSKSKGKKAKSKKKGKELKNGPEKRKEVDFTVKKKGTGKGKEKGKGKGKYNGRGKGKKPLKEGDADDWEEDEEEDETIDVGAEYEEEASDAPDPELASHTPLPWLKLEKRVTSPYFPQIKDQVSFFKAGYFKFQGEAKKKLENSELLPRFAAESWPKTVKPVEHFEINGILAFPFSFFLSSP